MHFIRCPYASLTSSVIHSARRLSHPFLPSSSGPHKRHSDRAYAVCICTCAAVCSGCLTNGALHRLHAATSDGWSSLVRRTCRWERWLSLTALGSSASAAVEGLSLLRPLYLDLLPASSLADASSIPHTSSCVCYHPLGDQCAARHLQRLIRSPVPLRPLVLQRFLSISARSDLLEAIHFSFRHLPLRSWLPRARTLVNCTHETGLMPTGR